MDTFFTQPNCDRCGEIIKGTRIMSMYNTDCLCSSCKELETKRKDYALVREAEINQVRKGNYNCPNPSELI